MVEYRHVQHDALRQFVARIVLGTGSNPWEAQAVADHLVDANLRGHDSHGIGMLPRYVRNALSGKLQPDRQGKVVVDAGPIIRIDGERGYGPAIARLATDRAIARTKEIGACVLALGNSHHIGRIGAYAEQAAAAGFVSMHMVNVVGDAPLVAPFRGADARLKTNPFTVGVPASHAHNQIILDMATSMVALGKVRVAMMKGETLPEGYIIDKHGKPATDPQVMFDEEHGALLPLGGHKGYGMALMAELLAGGLSGGGMSQMEGERTGIIINNMFSVLVDPGKFIDPGVYAAETEALIRHVKGSPPINPNEPVLIPGEPEAATTEERKTKGIPVDANTWADVEDVAKSVGVNWSA